MLNLDEYENVGLSEEHGTIIFTPNNSVRKTLKWGQKIEFIPSHCCTCVNQHDNLYVIKDEKVAAVWPITARGKYY
jgi:D-serine deaminase-like pyridoxal phosphate-dependent protein